VIFLSYRVEDSLPMVARLDNDLTERFGQHAVFRDMTRLPGGVGWSDLLETHAKTCSVMLVIIGSRWRTIVHGPGDWEGALRLLNPDDWVRQEIRLALDHDRLVIPVLLDDTTMPPAGWLANCGLADLAGRQARPLRARGFDYPTDLERLINDVTTACPHLKPVPPATLRPVAAELATRTKRVRHGSPPPMPSYFTGRDSELAALDEALGPKGLTAVTAVAGMGGVGKTQLAASYYRLHDPTGEFPVMAWIDGMRGIDAELVHLATELGLDEHHDAAYTIAELMSWLRTTDQRWLIVADNATDPTNLGPLLNAGGYGRLLVTSRYRHWDDYGHTLTLDTFPTDTAAALLRQVALRPDDPNAEALAEHLGGLALALTLAGAACRENGHSFARYLHELEARGLEPLTRAHTPTYDRTLAAVWEDSLIAATTRAPDAPVLLALLACLDWRNINRDWLTQGLTEATATLDSTLAALAAYQLVTLADTTIVIIHGIVATGATTDLSADRQASVDQLLAALFDATLPPPAPDLATVAAAAPAIHHLCRIAKSELPLTDLLWSPLLRACMQLQAEGDHARHVAIASKLADRTTRVYGEEHPQTLAARQMLGLAVRQAGRIQEAVDLFERLAGACEMTLGARHPNTLIALNQLGVTYRDADRSADAVPILKRVLKGWEAYGDRYEDHIIAVRANLATTYAELGRSGEAIILAKIVVSDCERVLGNDNHDTLVARSNLASCYTRAGRHTDALYTCELVLVDYERILGHEHPATIATRSNLANSFFRLGRVAQAMRIQAKVVDAYERVRGADDSETRRTRALLETMRNIASEQ
jgi:tetratricopeptide (TPR) repeat protein